jgi:hypothetical protein
MKVRITMCNWNGCLAQDLVEDAEKFGISFDHLEVRMCLETYLVSGPAQSVLSFMDHYDLVEDDE